jgi:hypothetical protein
VKLILKSVMRHMFVMVDSNLKRNSVFPSPQLLSLPNDLFPRLCTYFMVLVTVLWVETPCSDVGYHILWDLTAAMVERNEFSSPCKPQVSHQILYLLKGMNNEMSNT